ncbi:unnamed protein product [Larinioides sclopetarius]|uniref:Uncharacterized protein n=1 Tax=Larinioides sclopetarius TaxID=280406 RepID=A0AAV2BIV9_9ARAC
MSEKCGNLCCYNEPLTTDHAIILPDVGDCSYSRYLEVINSVIGSKHIHSIFESHGQIKIYFKDKKYVTEILESGVFLNKDYSQVSLQDFVLLKINLSRVDPAIPDNCIEDALKTYGHLESPIVHTKVSKSSDFDHIDCGVREVKLKVHDALRFPTKLNLFHNGIFYEVDAKVIEQTPLKRASDVMKTKKKDKHVKYISANVYKRDSSLICDSFPEWHKNNPDNCGGNKSQSSLDLLLQIHQSRSYLPKKNYHFYDKENNTTVLFQKKEKLPVIQEQQIVAFSKNCVANRSFDNAANTTQIVLEKQNLRSNGVILQNGTFNQSKQISGDKTLSDLNCDKTKRLDSTKKSHVKFKKIPKDISLGNVRTKPVKTFPNIKKDVATKVHNTRGTLKKRFDVKVGIYGKTVRPPNHPVKKDKSLREESDVGHNETNLPAMSSSSPNLSDEDTILSEKLGVLDNDVCSLSKSLNPRSAKKKIPSEEVDACDKNICPLLNSSLLNPKTVKRKTSSKKSCTYTDLVCSPSNSFLLKQRAVKEKTLAKSSFRNTKSTSSSLPLQKFRNKRTSEESVNLSMSMYPLSDTSALPLQKFGSRRTLEKSDNLNTSIYPLLDTSSLSLQNFGKRKTSVESKKLNIVVCPLSTFSPQKCPASKESVPHVNKCPPSKFSSPKLRSVKKVSSEEYSICNNDVSQPSKSSSLSKSRAVKRKASLEESGAASTKSPSLTNLAVQKRKKLKEKVIVNNNDVCLSSEPISSSNSVTDVPVSSLNDSNQNIVDIHHPVNLSAIPTPSEVTQSIFSHNPVISNTSETSPPNIANQHPTTEPYDDVLDNSTQNKENTNVEENFDLSDEGEQCTKTQIHNQLNNELVPCDLNVETSALSSSIIAQTSLQIPIFNSNTSDVDDSSSLKIPNHVSDGNLEENVSSNMKDPVQNLTQEAIDLNSSKPEKNDGHALILGDKAMHISLCEEKKTYAHVSPSLTLEAHSNRKDLDLSLCNPEELDSSKCQSQNTVPINISPSPCEDYASLHLNADDISVKTACDMPFSKSNCDKHTVESDLSNEKHVNKDKNNKNDISISNDESINSCSELTLSANQEGTFQHKLPNVRYNKLNSNEIDAHQYGKQQFVSKKCFKSKLGSSVTVNPASFLIKSTAKNKSKNYGKCPANKMVHRLQHKNSLNHQIKKQREYRNRQYLFSSTQDKNIYEYEFDSDEDYSGQVSYSKWKNQNCSSKELKKLDMNFSRRLTHSFNSYLQNKKRRGGTNDVIMDENSEVATFNNQISSISELRKRFKEAISPASSKCASVNKKIDANNYLPTNNVQKTGESSTKRKRVGSSENFCSDNDYFEVVHLGDGKHEKLSIIVKKKSKLNAPNKGDSVNVNSDLQTLNMISKSSPLKLSPHPHHSGSKYMNTVDQQNIKSHKRITSSDLVPSSSPALQSELFNLSRRNISYKAVPKYRVKSNTFSHAKVISLPKTSKEYELVSNRKHQDYNLVPESNTLNKKGAIGKSQQFLPSNSCKLADVHSSYKIVLQKISDHSSKNSPGQACGRKMIKTKYRLKSNPEESISKTDNSKLVNKDKLRFDKNSGTNNIFSGKKNNFKTSKQTEFVHMSKGNAVTASGTASMVQQNDKNEVDFHSCVNGFLQQLASCSRPNKVPIKDSHKKHGKNLLVDSDACFSQVSKFNHCNAVQNGVSLEKDLLECNREQNTPVRQEKSIHLTPELNNSFPDKISHSNLHSTSYNAKDIDDASCRVMTEDNSTNSLKECSVLLERISLPGKLLYNANASTSSVSESNTLNATLSVTSNVEENEQNMSSSGTLLYIKQEPYDSSTFDRLDSIIEIEDATSSFRSLSVSNCNHDLQSSDHAPGQDNILIQANDNAVITNVISCVEIQEDSSNGFCEVKEESHLEEYERNVTNYPDSVNKCILKQTELLNGNQELTERLNISEKCVEEYVNFQNQNLSVTAPNPFVDQIPKISTVSSPNNDFDCSDISRGNHSKITNSSDMGCSRNNTCFEGEEKVRNNVQNPHFVDSSKSINYDSLSNPHFAESSKSNGDSLSNPHYVESSKSNADSLSNPHYLESSKNNGDSESNMNKMKSSITFQALDFNGSHCSSSKNSAGKPKKGNTKLSIDKIAEFCALRKSASQIPAHQLKISLLKKQGSPAFYNEGSSKHLGSVPSISSKTVVECCAKPNFNEESIENKNETDTLEHLRLEATICGEVSVLSSETVSNKDVNFHSTVEKEQNGPLTLEKTRVEDRKRLTVSSCIGEPGISSDEKERSINPSNPVEVHVDKLAPVQLNQSGCERNNSTGALNRTDTYVVKSVAVKPQYIVNKSIPSSEKRIYPKLYKNYPLSGKKLIAFINCMRYTKNVKHTTLQMLAKNNTPGALKDLIVQLYEFFQTCKDANKKLQISRLIMLLNEK